MLAFVRVFLKIISRTAMRLRIKDGREQKAELTGFESFSRRFGVL